MKLNLNITLDVPDDLKTYSEPELRQLVFDAYINYVTVSHCHDALKWACEAKIGTPDEDAKSKYISEFHKTWADIAKSANWAVCTL